MKKPISLLMLISASFLLQAQPEGWEVNPAGYQYSMTVTGTIAIDEKITLQADDYLAAFHNDECRGITHPVYEEDMELWVVYLIIYSNIENEEINLKYYNNETDINIRENKNNNKAVIFPNPATSRITIKFEGYTNYISNIHVIDMSGRTTKVFNDLDKNDFHLLEWDFGNKSRGKTNSGVYILRFTHNNIIVSKPFIINY